MTGNQVTRHLLDLAKAKGFTRISAGETYLGSPMFRITLIPGPEVAPIGALPVAIHTVSIDARTAWEAVGAAEKYLMDMP